VVNAVPVAVSQVLWLVASGAAAALDSRNSTAGWAGKADDRAAVIDAGRTLAATIAARRGAIYRAAVCLAAAPFRLLTVQVTSADERAGATCRVSRPDFESTEHEGGACDAEDGAADSYPYCACC
jgi:hypothetical protein